MAAVAQAAPMAGRYRTYDAAWNRTGYSDAPQYSGQPALVWDLPPHCHCGGAWLHVSGIGSAVGRPDWDSATCASGHRTFAQPVETL